MPKCGIDGPDEARLSLCMAFDTLTGCSTPDTFLRMLILVLCPSLMPIFDKRNCACRNLVRSACTWSSRQKNVWRQRGQAMSEELTSPAFL